MYEISCFDKLRWLLVWRVLLVYEHEQNKRTFDLPSFVPIYCRLYCCLSFPNDAATATVLCASGMWRGGMRRYGRLIYGTCGSCRKMRERSNNKQTKKRKQKAGGSQATENSGH